MLILGGEERGRGGQTGTKYINSVSGDINLKTPEEVLENGEEERRVNPEKMKET